MIFQKKSIWIILVILLLLVGMAAAQWLPPRFEGQIQQSDTQVCIDFSYFKGQQTASLAVNAGDELEVSFDISRGTVDVTVIYADGSPLYRGKSVENSRFMLTSAQTGKVTITLEGHEAAGTVQFSIIP